MIPSQKIIGSQIHQFNNIQPNPIPRSTFDRSFPLALTHDTDYIYPVMNDEILPGDHIRLKMKLFTRLNPTVKPIMDNLYRDLHAFFVPLRLLWENFEKFQGAQASPGDSTAYTLPVYEISGALASTGFAVGSLQDYMEIPPLVSADADTKINVLYERAYNLIWNEWYKDENLNIPVTVPTGDGPDSPNLYTLLKRNKRKDYRTSSLPFPQKGPAATIPLSFGTLPVRPEDVNTPLLIRKVTSTAGAGPYLSAQMEYQVGGTLPSQAHLFRGLGTVADESGTVVWGTKNADRDTGLVVDIDQASGISINTLRELVTLQQMLELDARGGTRYTEALYSRWGVVAQDARLQRPELIGQSSSPITVYAVPQTAPTVSGTTPQGNLAAYSTGLHDGFFEYTAQEHGILLVLTNVRADLRYSQYLPRKRTRQTRTELYEPVYANVGEQPLRQDEVKWTGVAANDKDTFGYHEAWDDYRFKDPSITGLFRPAVPNNLAVWNLSQNLGGTPELNASFIEEAVPMSRVLAVTNEPAFLVEGHCQYIHTRAMPVRSNPGLTRL